MQLLKSSMTRAGATRSAAPLRSAVKPSRMLVARVAAAEVEAKKSTKKTADKKEVDESLPDVIPDTKQVENFLSILVNQTTIAEMHLQVGTFELKVRRSINGSAGIASAPAAAPAPTVVIAHAPPAPLQTIEESMEESLVNITSPKVGIFRRGKYAGNKRIGKGNIANKGDQVKKGQVLGFVEQLGTFVACESPQAGEIADFLVEDGQAVEYKQTIVELAPFFGGHIIGDSKYA